MTGPAADPSNGSFTKVADAFLALHRAGKNPSLEEAVAAFPEFGTEIRERLPAILALENVVSKRPAFVKLKAGDRIADCEIRAEIGRGSFGIVYEAFQQSLQRLVAIKAIRFSDVKSTEARRFELESRITAQLDHPNIVPVYGLVRQDLDAFLIMKRIDGQSLGQMLAGSPSSRQQAMLDVLRTDWTKFAEVARGLATGLAHAHENNLVHRDIKPTNVMLDYDLNPCITDFGLAKDFDLNNSFSMTGDIVGTPRYMSPEQFRGICDARSDIYSLGLTLYELATGDHRREFARSFDSELNAQKQLLKHHSTVMPEGLGQIIYKACKYSPEDRYQTASELVAVLERFIAGKKPDRRKGRRKPEADFRKQHRRNLILTAVTTVLVFALGLSIWTVASKTDTPDRDLLANLTDDPENGMATFMKDKTRESLRQATEELGLSAEEKQALYSRFDNFVGKLGKGSEDEIKQAVQHFRSSTLFDALRVMYLSNAVKNSGFSKAEKESAQASIRKLGLLVTRGDVSEEDANRWISELSGGRTLNGSELKQLSVADSDLRAWMQRLEKRVAPFTVSNEEMQQEVASLFEAIESNASNQQQDAEATVEPETKPPAIRKPAPAVLQDRARTLSAAEIHQIEQAINTLPRELQPQAREELRRALQQPR